MVTTIDSNWPIAQKTKVTWFSWAAHIILLTLNSEINFVHYSPKTNQEYGRQYVGAEGVTRPSPQLGLLTHLLVSRVIRR